MPQFGDDGRGEGGDSVRQKWVLTVMWLRATSGQGAHLLENVAPICCQPDLPLQTWVSIPICCYPSLTEIPLNKK